MRLSPRRLKHDLLLCEWHMPQDYQCLVVRDGRVVWIDASMWRRPARTAQEVDYATAAMKMLGSLRGVQAQHRTLMSPGTLHPRLRALEVINLATVANEIESIVDDLSTAEAHT